MQLQIDKEEATNASRASFPARRAGCKSADHAPCLDLLLSLVTSLGAGSPAEAAILGASASGNVPGVLPYNDVDSTSVEPLASVGDSISGTFGDGDVVVGSSAQSRVGQLSAAASASGKATPAAGGDILASATATWIEGMTVNATGLAGQQGTLTGSIGVSGTLIADFTGRAYTAAGVGASIDLFPGTGFNGGRTVVSNGSVINRGYDIAPRRDGNADDNFVLSFTIPFTFGRSIGFTAVLNTHVMPAAGPRRPMLGECRLRQHLAVAWHLTRS